MAPWEQEVSVGRSAHSQTGRDAGPAVDGQSTALIAQVGWYVHAKKQDYKQHWHEQRNQRVCLSVFSFQGHVRS